MNHFNEYLIEKNFTVKKLDLVKYKKINFKKLLKSISFDYNCKNEKENPKNAIVEKRLRQSYFTLNSL